jgi:hypothetical protein
VKVLAPRTLLVVIALVSLLTGCTWVKLTSEGEKVVVLETAFSACKKLGTTTSNGKADIASVDRNEEKVATELATLARNQAATMGGNAIVAQGPVTGEGQKTFAVYHCESE